MVIEGDLDTIWQRRDQRLKIVSYSLCADFCRQGVVLRYQPRAATMALRGILARSAVWRANSS